jgi:hypothetical protein
VNITRKRLLALTAAAGIALAAGALGITTASASPAPVTRVAGLHVTAATTTTLAIAWAKAADPNAKVRVQVYDADTLADTWDSAYKGGDVAGTTVTATGLAAGTAYDVRADEYDGTRNSGWTDPVTVYTAAAGSTGTQGPAGPAGPSGVVSVTTKDLGAVASVATGGSFVTNAKLVGTVSLKAGTYLVSVSAKATPLMTGAVQVFPQFFVYDQPANAAFTGDLFNVGSGALESGGNVNIDSYYTGSSVITLASATTLDLYAFGYDSDRGAGTYALDDLTVTAVQLQAAS